MDPAFNALNVRPELACVFLAVFARSEYALKAAGSADGNEKEVEADWPKFGKEIAKSFEQSKSQDLRTAVDYLMTKPPQKQVPIGRSLTFSDSPQDKNKSEAHQVLLMVRRVRNNLFHGGKFLPPPAGDPDRDKLLIEHPLTVLRACIPLHEKVAEAYVK